MNSSEGFRLRFMRWVASLVVRWPWPIVMICTGLAVLSAVVTWNKLTLDSNPSNLLSSDASYHRRYHEYTQEFRAEEDYAILVCGPEFERNRQCVEFIAKKLGEHPHLFKKVFYRIDFSELRNRGLLFLNLKQLAEIEKAAANFTGLIGKEGVKLDLHSLLKTANDKIDPKYMKQEGNWQGMQGFLDDFVKSLEMLADKLEGKDGKKKVGFGNFIAEDPGLKEMEKKQIENEYIAFEAGRILLINVPSPSQAASFGQHEKVITPLKEIIAEARSKFPGLEIGLTGEPALSEDESQTSMRDTSTASAMTLVLISLLFWFAYREFSRPGLALLALLAAVCCTFGFTTITYGHLNILSVTFVPMILGLGVDFGIQILARYEEELSRTSDVIEAITRSIMYTGNAILTGGSTTALAFYTMCLNKFIGLREMGIVSGTGIILCLVANLVLLPALLFLRDRRGKDYQVVPASQRYESKQTHFFDRMVLSHAWTVIGIAAAFTILAAFQIPRLWFDYNLLKLQNPTLESVRFERKLLDSKGSRSVVFAASINNSLKEAEAKAEKFKKLPTVHEVVSITEMVPMEQEKKISIITRIKQSLKKIQVPESGIRVNVTEDTKALDALKSKCDRFARLSGQFGYKEESKVFTRLVPPMERALTALRSLDQGKAGKILNVYENQVFGELRKNLQWLKNQKVDRPMTDKDLPPIMRERYVGHTGKILIEVYPKDDIWERVPLTEFVRELRTVDPDITGTPVQNYEYIELLRTSYEQAGLYALGAVVFLIVIHFRKPGYIFPTLLPLVLGITWALGLMPIINLPFNPANIITLPMVIGIGVAYGVYIVDRFRETESPALFFTSTGKAILLSALTAMIGFSSLALASHRGIASLGLLMTIGVTLCMVASLCVCPAILQVLGRHQRKAG